MRTNAFGEIYYHPNDDLGSDDSIATARLDAEDDGEAFAPNAAISPPDMMDGDHRSWSAEITDNATGQTLCHVEDFDSQDDLKDYLLSHLGADVFFL